MNVSCKLQGICFYSEESDHEQGEMVIADARKESEGPVRGLGASHIHFRLSSSTRL